MVSFLQLVVISGTTVELSKMVQDTCAHVIERLAFAGVESIDLFKAYKDSLLNGVVDVDAAELGPIGDVFREDIEGVSQLLLVVLVISTGFLMSLTTCIQVCFLEIVTILFPASIMGFFKIGQHKFALGFLTFVELESLNDRFKGLVIQVFVGHMSSEV